MSCQHPVFLLARSSALLSKSKTEANPPHIPISVGLFPGTPPFWYLKYSYQFRSWSGKEKAH